MLRVRRFAALVEGRVEAFLLGRGASARQLVDVMRRTGRGGQAGWAADASREIAALLREVVGQRAHVQALRTGGALVDGLLLVPCLLVDL